MKACYGSSHQLFCATADLHIPRIEDRLVHLFAEHPGAKLHRGRFGLSNTGAAGDKLEAWSPNFIPLILGIVVQLALVRLLLEVAAFIISTSRARA
jgi:hypothetical protein